MILMKYPPCGRLCEVCEAWQKICSGCIKSREKSVIEEKKIPEWVRTCPVWKCINKHEVEHCGQCSKFPCKKFLNWYNPEHGKKSVLSYIGLLLIRKKLGTKEWIEWVRIHKKESYSLIKW